MKLSKEKQQHLIGVVIGTVVVVVVLYMLVISSQQSKIKKLQGEIAKASKLVNDAQKDIDNEKYKLEMLGEWTNKLAQLEAHMMPTNEVYSTFRSALIQFRTQHSRVDITDIGKERVMPLGMYSPFPYATAVFTVRGTAYYHDFGRFVAELESQFPFYRVQKFNLAAGGLEVSTADKLTFEMDIVTLIRPN